MFFLLKKKGIILFTLLLMSFALHAQKQPATVPEFKFFRLDGSPFTNKSLASNKLLFFIFFDISCEHCHHAIEKLSRQYGDFSKAAIYLVTLDKPDGIKTFLDKYAKNLPGKQNVTILQDLHNEFINKFKPVKYPSMFLYSHNKKLLLYDDEETNFSKFSDRVKMGAVPGKG